MKSVGGRVLRPQAERREILLRMAEGLPRVPDQSPAAAPRRPAPLPPEQRVLVVLVGCVKGKLDRPAPAQDLYTSTLFRLRRRYAEGHASDRWAILSALHGLVMPTEELAPYNWRLSDMRPRDRWSWAHRAADAVEHRFGQAGTLRVEIHAGEEYWRDLAQDLRLTGAEVVVPTRGMSIGRQQQWYAEQARVS